MALQKCQSYRRPHDHSKNNTVAHFHLLCITQILYKIIIIAKTSALWPRSFQLHQYLPHARLEALPQVSPLHACMHGKGRLTCTSVTNDWQGIADLLYRSPLCVEHT